MKRRIVLARAGSRALSLRLSALVAVACLAGSLATVGQTHATGPDRLANGLVNGDDARASDIDAVERRSDGSWVIPLSLTEVGGERLHFFGREGRTRVRLPVPEGLSPVALEGSMSWSPDVSTGFIGYTATGDRMRSILVGNASHEQSVAAAPGTGDEAPVVRFDLSQARVVSNSLDIDITHRLETDDAWCTTSLTGSWAEFEGVLILSGEPSTPITIAEFGTPLLSRLEIQLDSQPTAAEAQAATDLSLAFSRASLNSQINVDVESSPTPSWSVDSDPMTTRRVVISRIASEGIALGAGGIPTLTLRSPDDGGAALRQSAEFVASELASFAIASEVSVNHFDAMADQAQNSPTRTTQPRSGDVALTFREAGLERAAQSGLGSMQSQFTVSQSILGGPVASLQLDLVLVHSTVQAGATARADVAINGVLIESIPLGVDANEIINIEVPPAAMTRDVFVEMNVSYTPAGGVCRNDELSLTWQLDPNQSSVTGRVGQSLDPGFERFPQVLQSGVNVGIEPLAASTIELAANLLNSLQRSSAGPIRATVTTITGAVDGIVPAILVTRSSPDFLRSAPIVDTDPLRVLGPQQRAQLLSVDTDESFALLQAYEAAGRDFLAVVWQDGTDDDGLAAADALVRSLNSADYRFSSLFGEVYLASLDSAPVAVSLAGPSSIPTDRRTAPDYAGRINSIAVAMVGVALVVCAWQLGRRRRARRRPRATPMGDTLSSSI